MNKKVKSRLVTIGIVLAIALIMFFALYDFDSPNETPNEIVECIGENSILYVQLGCHYCGVQEEIFGDNLDLINKIDCFYEKEKCGEIQATPTWKINGELYRGVKSIEELQELTGC